MDPQQEIDLIREEISRMEQPAGENEETVDFTYYVQLKQRLAVLTK